MTTVFFIENILIDIFLFYKLEFLLFSFNEIFVVCFFFIKNAL